MRNDSSAEGREQSSSANAGHRHENVSSAQDSDSELSEVLHPDVSFACPPITHILFVLAFEACALVSLSAMLVSLPLQSKNSPEPRDRWWLAVLFPQLGFLLAAVSFHGYAITQRERAIRVQIGPSPDPATTSGGSVLQHTVLQRVFLKQYVAANASDMVLYASIAVSITILLVRLEQGAELVWRVIALPIALGGLCSVILQTLYRVRNRGALPTVSTRSDFAIIFVFLAAYKLDREAALSWTITFIFLFWWLIAFVLLGLAGLVVYHAGRRARLWSAADLRVRLAISLLHLSYVFLLAASVFLLKFLRGKHKLTENPGSRQFATCLSLTIAWVLLSSAAQIAVFWGQKDREAERERQIAEGRVWTATGTLHNEMATVTRQVDALSPDEIVKKASEMMAGVTKPEALYRIDVNLWSTTPKPSQTAADASIEAVDTSAASRGADDAVIPSTVSVSSAEAAVPGPSISVGSADVAVDLVPDKTISTAALPDTGDTDKLDMVTDCVICMEATGDHVVMPCGHGGYCRHCAHKVYVRPPNQCPICRARLTSVVKVSLETPIGNRTGVE